ncbi:hypothetical protein FB451DRAFT_1553350 [Mycena latifolia]|nr:hypothetical protein FB451DRAFT_1553350 [Mycena latifolia]
MINLKTSTQNQNSLQVQALKISDSPQVVKTQAVNFKLLKRKTSVGDRARLKIHRLTAWFNAADQPLHSLAEADRLGPNSGRITKSAHPASFSPDDKFSRHRVTIKKTLRRPAHPAARKADVRYDSLETVYDTHGR